MLSFENIILLCFQHPDKEFMCIISIYNRFFNKKQTSSSICNRYLLPGVNFQITFFFILKTKLSKDIFLSVIHIVHNYIQFNYE